MWQPKRVWSNKKTVWDGKKSVWLQDWELKTYDGNWEDAGSDLQTYWSQWEEVSDDAILDVYDSNTPEPIWTPEDWIKATYTFKDYDGTVLKTGTVDDWWTPVAPTDPTREWYTFDWWNPTVWPISKNTEYVAVYTANATLVINDELSDTTGEVWGTVKIYFTAPSTWWLLFSGASDIMTVSDTETVTWEEWYNRITTFTVTAAGTATLTITANPSWLSDSIAITTTAATVAQEWWAQTATINNEVVNVSGASTKRCTYNYTSSAEYEQDTTAFNVSIWIVPSNATIDVDNDLDWDISSGATVDNVAISNWVLSFTVAPETTWEDSAQASVTVTNMVADLSFNPRINISYE